MQPGRMGLTLNRPFPQDVSAAIPHHHHEDRDGFEDIISYLRDYIAICKNKKTKKHNEK